MLEERVVSNDLVVLVELVLLVELTRCGREQGIKYCIVAARGESFILRLPSSSS